MYSSRLKRRDVYTNNNINISDATSTTTSAITSVNINNTPDKIKSLWIENFTLYANEQLDPIILDKIFDIIHNFTKNLHVFTTYSIVRALINIVDMCEDVETFLNMYSIEALKHCVSEYVKFMKLRSKITINDLSSIHNELAQNNISLRQLFIMNYGMMETIDGVTLLEIFRSANLNSLLDVYGRFDDSQTLNLINDIFRPIEGIIDELPVCVVVPSYNNIQTLNTTSASIYKQDYTNYRVIFVDDISDDPLELDTILTISKDHCQDSRYMIMKQYTKQRQCAGRYIGYHMAYDDEIIMFLDGDDMFYNAQTMSIINNAYINSPVAMTYGSHVDLHEGIVHSICKGGDSFPSNIIKNKQYRYHAFLSAHLRTGYAYLFKNIHITDLMHNDRKFFKIMTDYAEMIPALEMITPDDLNCIIMDDVIDLDNINNINNKSSYVLPYLKVIKKPVYIYNMDNSLQYQTSFARRDEKDNEYYKNYRLEAADYIRSLTKYGFTIRKNDYNKNTPKNYLMSLMQNYHIDILIINTDCNNDESESDSSNTINKFYSDECLYLTGVILNNTLNHTFEIGDTIVTLDQLCLKAVIISCESFAEEYEDLQKRYYLILNSNIDKQIKDLVNTVFVVGYLELE